MSNNHSHNVPSASFDPVGEQTLQIISNAQKFNQWMFERIEPFLKGNVLEIGSGIGNITAFVLAKGLTVTASDYNTSYQEQLKENLKEFSNLEAVLSLDLQSTNLAQEYPDLEGKFDSIFLLNVIEHLKDENLAIENCRYLLRKGGNLIVLAPSYQFLYCQFDKELGHYRRYTKKRMAQIFPVSEFSIKHQEYFNLAGTAGWFIFGKLLQRKQIGSEMNLYEKLVPVFKWVDRLSFRAAGLSTITIA